MTNRDEFVAVAESDLRRERAIGPQAREMLRELADAISPAYGPAVNFPGRGDIGSGQATGLAEIQDRRAASRLMLLKMSVDTSDPRWSSDVLARYVQAVLAIPGGTLDDVFFPLLTLLSDYRPELTPVVAHFLKDLVVSCFTRFRPEYERVDWTAFVQALGSRPTPPLCYLGLLAVPPQHMPEKAAELILSTLMPTPFGQEAKSLLAA